MSLTGKLTSSGCADSAVCRTEPGKDAVIMGLPDKREMFMQGKVYKILGSDIASQNISCQNVYYRKS